MRPQEEHSIAVMVTGLPECLRTEEAMEAARTYVKVRLHIHHRITLPLYVRFAASAPQERLDIVVLADSLGADARRTVAWLTEDSLRALYAKYRCAGPFCTEFHV